MAICRPYNLLWLTSPKSTSSEEIDQKKRKSQILALDGQKIFNLTNFLNFLGKMSLGQSHLFTKTMLYANFQPNRTGQFFKLADFHICPP